MKKRVIKKQMISTRLPVKLTEQIKTTADMNGLKLEAFYAVLLNVGLATFHRDNPLGLRRMERAS